MSFGVRLLEIYENALHRFRTGKTLAELPQNEQQELQELLDVSEEDFSPYLTDIGSLVFEANFEQANRVEGLQEGDEFMKYLKKVFKDNSDKRCEVGQVLRHTDAVKFPKREQFLRNAASVVMIVAMDPDELPPPDADGKILVPSLPCDDVLDFSSFDHSFAGKKLCEDFFYNTQLIPDCSIFGSGCFVAPNKIVTAAHVLEAAFHSRASLGDLLIIRRHWTYGKEAYDSIRVKKEQLYRVPKKEIFSNNRVIYGETGDITWLPVEPCFGADTYNDATGYLYPVESHFPGPIEGNPAYAIGHSLGVPMKLSFKGRVGRIGPDHWIQCDMDVFPGNSGSPIFHANTHQLLGIVSGASSMMVNMQVGNFGKPDCVGLKVYNHGKATIINTQYLPITYTFNS